MDKIIRVSTTFSGIFTFLAAISLPFTVFWGCRLLWLVCPLFHKPGLAFLFTPSNLPLPTHGHPRNILALMLFFLALVLFNYALWQLRNLFWSYTQGKVFKKGNSAYLRRAAVSFLGITFLSIVIERLMNASRVVSNFLGVEELPGILIILQLSCICMSVLLIVLAWIMEEGRRLQDEIDSTI